MLRGTNIAVKLVHSSSVVFTSQFITAMDYTGHFSHAPSLLLVLKPCSSRLHKHTCTI